MRHWDLIADYPKITTETPEAIEDFLETVKANLQALERLGDPVTSNTVLLKVFTSKLPSSTIRKWQRTLPNKQLPPYTHLVDFLKARTNGDRVSYTSTERKKRSSDKHIRQRQPAPRSYAFVTTRNALKCPICQGEHNIWHCEVFKTKSAKRRLDISKEALLCTNCLGKGHSLAQCSAGSCRVCRQRHHTYLHQDQGHVATRTFSGRSSSSRSSSDRSSNGHSSNDRSHNGRSPPASSTSRSSHRSRRSDTSPRTPPRSSSQSSPEASPRSSPQMSPKTSSKHESRSSRTRVTGSNRSPKSQRHGEQ
jgi:hypothetical protein